MNDIPIFIHHESDEKPSKGLGEKQSYLKFVVKQAEKYNNRVILFGDEFNRGWANEWKRSDNYVGDKWHRFEKAFTNMSDYPNEWAKGIFRRFFVFEEFCKKNDIDDFIVLDSDVLIYEDIGGHYPFREICETAFEWEETVRFDRNYSKEGSVSSGIGYFTYDAVCSFTSFCIVVYEDKIGEIYKRLEQKWEKMQNNHSHGGVCEMTLLYYWICNSSFKVINLLERQDNVCFCNSFKEDDNYRKKEFDTIKILNVKRFRFNNGMPEHFDLKEKRWIRVFNIHFAGDSKRFIPDIYKYHKITLTTCIYYALIHVWRAKIKPIIMRV